METTTYTCDRCEGSSTNRDELRLTSVRVVWGDYFHSPCRIKGPLHVQWCQTCCVELGIIPLLGKKQPPPVEDTALTLEDLVREIVHKEIEESQ